MIHAPASGERSALRGYQWQYDHIASLVYDALIEGDLDRIRLTDPQAGRVDDLVLIRRSRTDGYQFKGVTYDSYLTFGQVIKDQRTRGGGDAPSLLRSLADGWQELRRRWENVHVHLVAKQLASTNDHLGGAEDKPSPDHFSAFLSHVLVPIRLGEVTLGDVRAGWRPALARLRKASGLAQEDFDQFIRALYFEMAAGSGLPPSLSTRRSDVAELSSALLRRVSESRDVVELDRRQLLDLMGWRGRPRLQSRHEFPVDLDTYQPLTVAIGQLKTAVARHDSGYVAVIGPPGAGKSTLLSQALTGSVDRLVRYYAYVPGTAPARTRLTAQAYLHDIVVMLGEAGVKGRHRELPGNDVNQLRQQLIDHLDAASGEFLDSGRRTIVVVDGLDHVDREGSSGDGLLAELPRPEELPDGVVFIVGSRTLAPLNPFAQQQLEDRQSAIDLQHHRLSPASILEICRRAPLTTDYPPETHQRIAELSSGHPLALSYLLNRLRDADGQSAEKALASAPPYAGDVAAEYRAVWNEIEDDNALLEILAVCSRLRIAFTTEWLTTWAPQRAVQTFQRKLLYLFRPHHNGWRFFHDSFRQFAADRTAFGDDARPDSRVDIRAHRQIARLCAEADDPRYAWEQLYHRHCGDQGDQVLELARQAVFREQYDQLRSPNLIREDITLAIQIAAERTDVLTMVRLLLALVEGDQRTYMLENVDMPGLLYDAGLIDEAIAWCGEETRRVPLAHAYDLATRLGSAGDPAGRQLFDLVEHDGMDDPNRTRILGEEDSAALAWTRAAVLFRPFPNILAAIQHLVDFRTEFDDPREERIQADRWRRYCRMLRAAIHAVKTDETSLSAIHSVLADDTTQLNESRIRPDTAEEEKNTNRALDHRHASLIDLRVQAHAALLDAASTAEVAEGRIEHLLATVSDVPLFASTNLDLAELLAAHGKLDRASSLLDRAPYNHALTVRDFGHDAEPDAIDHCFRYWRLRYLLASSDEDVPPPIPPDPRTPAGNRIALDAPIHRDFEAIELSARIDFTVRTLARLDAKTLSGHPVPVSDAWQTLVPLLDLYPPPDRPGGANFMGLESTKREVFGMVVAVAGSYGRGLPQRLTELLQLRFRNQPERWPTWVRLNLADDLRLAGAATPWYRDTLATYEASIAAQSVDSRLADTSDLVLRYARDGESDTARRLVLALVPMAFGVGFRKDYQFDAWIAWLGRALAEPGGERFVNEAAWLARLLTAVDPMTEGAPGTAAVHLPAAVAPAAPLPAVRIFEYLVRHGTVSHVTALASLVQALVFRVATTAGVELAADITGELLARAGKRAHSELANAIVAAAVRIAGPSRARRLADSIAARTNCYALPTTRRDWRRGLGLETDTDEHDDSNNRTSRDDDYTALVLNDGRRIARGDVAARIRTVDDIVAFRRAEAAGSHFSWSPIIEQHRLSNDDVKKLIDPFNDESHESLQVFAVLAAAAERNGDHETALRISSNILRTDSGRSWSRSFGGARLSAAAIAIRVGGQQVRVQFFKDLAHQLVGNRGLPSLLISDLQRIIRALDPELPASAIWPEIRVYLEGMAETLELPDSEVLSDHRCRWWLQTPTADRRAPSDSSTPMAALAEVAVGHLSHPAWLIRDASTNVVVRALRADDSETAKALARFAQPAATDDILERAGRCLAAARAQTGFAIPDCLLPLEHLLAGHPSQVIRDLAADSSPKSYRALSPMYDFELPPSAVTSLESESPFLAPHVGQYRILANRLGLSLDAVLAVAARYASQAARTLPNHEAVVESLRSSHAQFRFPTSKIASSRAAFGRVLADIADSGLLDKIPPKTRRLFRTVDIDLLNLAPTPRPTVLAPPPQAGVEKTIDQWRAGIETRLEGYIRASTLQDRILIGATGRLTVLNWGHLEEEFIFGSTVETAQSEKMRLFARRYSLFLSDLLGAVSGLSPEAGEPLLMANNGSTFLQPSADWISFRPRLAATLKWTPDPSLPGRWHTESGDLAAETVWWVDGWWGHADRAFDDTVAQGHAVIATLQGFFDIADAFGVITRHFELTRSGRDDEGADVEPVSAAQSLPVVLADA